MLGHKSATMTLDLYGHLFGDRLDEVADAPDAAAARASREPSADFVGSSSLSVVRPLPVGACSVGDEQDP
jgi:hypothetical protein